jgi:hypothetical protein
MSDFHIRPLAADETPLVEQLARAVWNDHYPFAWMLYDEHSGPSERLSVVATDETGRIVAHDCLKIMPGNVGKVGMAMVLPDCRGHRLMLRTRTYLVELAWQRGLRALFGQPVTSHVHSQRVYEELGFTTVGIWPSYLPGDIAPRGVESAHDAPRQDLLSCFVMLERLPPRRLYAPTSVQAILSELYQDLGVTATFLDDANPTPQDARRSPSRAWLVDDGPELGVAHVRLMPWAACSQHELEELLASLTARAAVYLEIPLEDPRAPAMYEFGIERGFFFCGLTPCGSHCEDALCLAWLRDPLAAAATQIGTAKAQRLAEYIEQQRARAGGGRRPVVRD